MTSEEISTKEKILKTAYKLFAKKGLNGVGIREIATQADVNVAAINYHFGNKTALYDQTVGHCMSLLRTHLEEGAKKIDSSSMLALYFYDHLIEDHEGLITSFKLFLDTNTRLESVCAEDKPIGPPGGEFLFSCMKNEYTKASEVDLGWAVRTIFTQVIHTALLVSLHEKDVCSNTGLTKADIRSQLTRTINVILKEL